MKQCYKCKKTKQETDFGKLSKSPDGLKYDCKQCRKDYNENNKILKKNYNQQYFLKKKDELLEKNKSYRENNKIKIYIQRKQYREENVIHIQEKRQAYKQRRNKLIKERRKFDIKFRIAENLKTKIHNVLSNELRPSSEKLIGCNRQNLIEFIEYQFDDTMNWSNYGVNWHIDHVLAINKFDLKNEDNQNICFNWKNLQPLHKFENQSKSDTFVPHMFFNHLITIMRFIKYKSLNNEYQGVIEKLHWLRTELRYGNNLKDDGYIKLRQLVNPEMGNPQPSL